MQIKATKRGPEVGRGPLLRKTVLEGRNSEAVQRLGLAGHSDCASAGWAWEAMATLQPRAWGPQSSLHLGVVLTPSTILPRASSQVKAMMTEEGNVPFCCS